MTPASSKSIPKSLHKSLSVHAKEEGVSMNQ
ncbi:MAG: toxin-antitoxin system HicB family antitoxin [Succinivibrionaceae bacterium]|nr:toxin-antitoxin system HicB family antitoxin [Succinivibrionaceae bacterium]